MKEIDLHGIRHLNVEKHLMNLITSGCIPFVVITGNSRRMKELVSQIVSKFGLYVRDQVGNSGRLVIDENR